MYLCVSAFICTFLHRRRIWILLGCCLRISILCQCFSPSLLLNWTDNTQFYMHWRHLKLPEVVVCELWLKAMYWTVKHITLKTNHELTSMTTNLLSHYHQWSQSRKWFMLCGINLSLFLISVTPGPHFNKIAEASKLNWNVFVCWVQVVYFFLLNIFY